MQIPRKLRESFRDTLLGHRVVVAPPVGRTMSGGDDEPDCPDVRPDKASGWTVHIGYLDANGKPSERTITCKRVSVAIDGDIVIMAYCHHRRAPRRFKVSRIVEAVAIDTGELLDPHSYFASLATNGLPIRSSDFMHFTRALVFLARCDGQHCSEEWEAIERGLTSYVLRHGQEGDDVDVALTTARQLSPSGEDFMIALRALGRSSQRAGLARLLLNAAKDVVDADGQLAEEEIEWMTPTVELLSMAADQSASR